ncbi:SsrA-binding protein SmpB [Prochlorococcus marinus]|uniref:SsrA-binding protein n=1 Tax=Prochlorococcus marinus (strain MIT 9211) TaxID=93059 RepID=SSRP_PROM4|nr:SsrA-binding protein SmpB [Prochlorococcus marinus]A9BD59.1 RecName: Full=SsrA-binding protein; AltName: Full=Small protein B [Prochlorococcus marinus str. MIT 9211]ABX09672.1 tmRNA binding protein SmpB [Prochlorococcus marinus str. MIT 9211]
MTKKKNKKVTKSERGEANRRLAENRLARHQYEILETLETGIELVGTEVKSIRAGNTNLRDGFCLIREGELQLHNVHISPLNNAGNFFNHDPLRTRKLLAHRKEINKLEIQVARKGLTLIPLSIHLKGSWIKIIIGVGKGRKLHDKREDDKRKQANRDMKSALARYR